MKKKPVIITIVIVAILAVATITSISLYPYLTEHKISEIVNDDMQNVVKIELSNGTYGGRAEVTDKNDIKEITEQFSNIKVKKSIIQTFLGAGSSLSLTMVNSDNTTIEITFEAGVRINGTRYNYDRKLIDPIIDSIDKHYNLTTPAPREEYIIVK